MAKISGDMWDDLADQLKKAEAKTPKIMDKAVTKAAQIYVRDTRDEIYDQRLVDSGELYFSVKKGPVSRLPSGRRVEVWPQGNRYDKKHPKGERMETIGFVLIHGRPGKYKARDYLTAADKKAGPRATEAIADMLQEAFKE